MKRIVFPADLHCGHFSGLTPPGYQWPIDCADPHRAQWGQIQRRSWNWWLKTAEALQPVYLCCVMGDPIDGKGPKTGGTELIVSDMIDQAEMAAECLRVVRPTNGYVLLYGTGYHTANKGDDVDRLVANRLPNAEMHNHAVVNVDGFRFDLRHHIGGGTSPTGGDVALRKEEIWNLVWKDHGVQPNVEAFVRGHVHRRRVVDSVRTCPALQQWTKFGRRLSSLVHFGVMWADIYQEGELPGLLGRKPRVIWDEEITVVRGTQCKVIQR